MVSGFRSTKLRVKLRYVDSMGLEPRIPEIIVFFPGREQRLPIASDPHDCEGLVDGLPVRVEWSSPSG